MSEQAPAIPEPSRESPLSPRLMAWPSLAAALGIVATAAASLCLFYARGLTNLYGDGIAHILAGANRVGIVAHLI